MLAVVRDSVRGMLNNYKRHVQMSREDFIVRHEGECATMRILEGSSVLIDMSKMGPKMNPDPESESGPGPSTSSTSPSSSTGQASEGSSPASSSEPSEATHDSQGGNDGNWLGDLNDKNADFRMLDFSGVYHTPDPVQLHHAPSYVSPSVYLPLETGPEDAVAPTEPPMQGLQQQKLTGYQEGLTAPQNGGMYPAPAGYGQTESMVVQNATMPPYAVPPEMQYDSAMAGPDMYQGLLNQNGYMAQYDQAGWEKFLREMGMPSTHA